MKAGKGVALRKEQALLHTFAAGQKYGVWRDATRRSCFKVMGAVLEGRLSLLLVFLFPSKTLNPGERPHEKNPHTRKRKNPEPTRNMLYPKAT